MLHRKVYVSINHLVAPCNPNPNPNPAAQAHVDDDIKECTFRPQLISEALVKDSLVKQYIQTGAVPIITKSRPGGSPIKDSQQMMDDESQYGHPQASAPGSPGAAGVLLDDQVSGLGLGLGLNVASAPGSPGAAGVLLDDQVRRRRAY